LQDDVSSQAGSRVRREGQLVEAAGEFERLAAANRDRNSRVRSLQAAEMYEKAKAERAARVYDRYLKRNPQPLEPAVEARYRLARMRRMTAIRAGTGAAEEIQQADYRRRRRTTTRYSARRRRSRLRPGSGGLSQGCAGRA